MKARLTKWGNSLAVRIPKPIAEEAGLRQGDGLEIVANGHGQVELRARSRRLRLKELVKGINARNLHDATDWGAPAGKEIW